MHKLFPLLLGALLLGSQFTCKAQTYKIDTTTVTFETKSRECLFTTVDPQAKELKQALKKYLKKTYQIKLKGVGFLTNKSFLKAEDVMCGAISSKRLNIYAHITQAPTVSQMSFFASFGYDIFVDPKIYSKEFGELKNIMNTFLLQYLNDYYAKEIEATASDIKKNNNKRTSLAKRIDKNERKSNRAERKIKKLNDSDPSDSKKQIENTDKANILTNKKTKLANESQRATVSIQLIDDKLPKLNNKLKELMSKQKNLSKVVL